MNKKVSALCEELLAQIEASYEQGIGLEEAERLAGKFLAAQMHVANAMRDADLDSRMRKSGVKAIRAAVYLENATKSDKKPSDVLLQAIVDKEQVVQSAEEQQHAAEVERNRLQNFFEIFGNAHIHYRGIAKNGSYLA